MLDSSSFVDADGHVRDDDENIRPYLDAPFNRRASLGMTSNDSFDRHMGGTLGSFRADAEVWLDALERGGLSMAVLYPTIGLRNGHIREPDFAVARCRAYNTWLYEEYLRVDQRFKGVALLPVQDPKEAAIELRRAVTELGMVGGMLPEGPYLYGDSDFDPIYEEAQRLDRTITIHEGGNVWDSLFHHLFPSLIQTHTLGHPFAQMRHFTNIIFSGVPARFPRLRMAFLEAGCGWVPFILDRMDERYRLRGAVEAPLLTKKPSDYVRDGNLYFSCEAGESLLPAAVGLFGGDIFLYASDFPHWDADYPRNLHELLERSDLTEEQRVNIAGANALRLYGLAKD